jgi:DNA-binding GntR family transcriptional regulator
MLRKTLRTRSFAKTASELPSLPDIAYEALRERILSGALAADEPLRQEKLATDLSVSRVPVRAALARLEAEGLVVLRPRRGYVVASLNAQDIDEVTDLRALLEDRATYLATLKRTTKDVREVEAIFRRMYGMRIASDKDLIVYATLNYNFHQRIFAATGHKRLCGILTPLQDSAERLTRLGAHAIELDRAHEEHRLIFEAFKGGNAVEAGRLAADHARKIGDRLIELLRDQLSDTTHPDMLKERRRRRA